MSKPESFVRENESSDPRSEIEELKRVKQKFQVHLSNSPLAVIEFDPFYHITSWSEEAERLFGWSADEVIGKTVFEIKWVHEEDVEGVNQISADMLSNRNSHHMHANRNYRKDGSVVHCEWYNSAIYDENGQLASILSFVLDVTERKRAEAELKESEDRFRNVFENAAAGMLIADPNRDYLAVNDRFCEITGYSREALLTMGCGQLVHPDDQAVDLAEVERLIRGETKSFLRDPRYVHANGSIIWVRVHVSTFESSSNGEVKIIAVVEDITERKQAEEYLRNEKLRMEVAQESAQAGAFEWDIINSRTVWSDQLKALYGFAPGEFKGFEDWSSRVHPDDLGYSKRAIREALSTGKYDVDFRIIWPDGSLHWLGARGKLIYDEQGQPLYMTGINMDITERKRAEDMLYASKRKIETILENITDIFILYDQQWRFTDLNTQAEKSLGKNRAQLIGKVLWEVFPELKKTEIYRRYLKAAETKLPAHFEAYSPATRKWHEFHAYPLEDGFSVYMRDISVRKQAEEALRESQEKYKAIFETSNDALMLVDENGFIDCNSQTIRTFGFADKKEFIKRHPADLSPVRQPDGRKSFPAAMEHIRNALEQGYDRFEWVHSRNNGEEFLADVILSALTINNKKVVQAVVRDITELKRAQEALQQSNEQLEQKVRERTAQLTVINKSLLAEIAERKRTETKLLTAQKNLRAMASEVVTTEERSRQHFATDLHDTVVQTLGAAKLRAQIIEDQIPKKAQPSFTLLQSMLSESILQARSIMAEMSPPVLNELGIKSALEWLTEEISKKHEIMIEFKSANSEGLSLPREIEVLLFQATRELLMNVVKHAQARNAGVKFSCRGKNVRIEVSDDGSGLEIRKTFQPDLKGGFGLYGIRERLRHIGGRLAIKSKLGQGTTVLITAPREI